MDLRVFTEPQFGATYDDLLRVARASEDLGFDAFFRSDHYLTMGGDGLPGPSDAWITLAGLARDTSRIRLGTMVTAATFRLPGPLAIAVANVDQMSGGRVELGIGAGWFAEEHSAYGIPFPSTKERFDRLEAQLAVLTGLWGSEGPFSFQGSHYALTDSPALPKPAQSPVPVIVGGGGPTRTPALAATYATEFNAPFLPLDRAQEQYDRVRAAGGEHLVLSIAHTTCVGRDEAGFRRRAEAIGRSPEQARTGFGGTVPEVVEKIAAYGELGATRAYVQVLDLSDLDHLELIATEVARQL
jgi:F420-dependent oxidoreductase-like protein